MSETTKPNGTSNGNLIHEIAMTLFSAAVASRQVRGREQKLAIDSYRNAETLLAVRKRYEAGELKVAPETETGPKLADVFCPNQNRNAPENLVAKSWTDKRSGQRVPGDLVKVRRVHTWLLAHPADDYEEIDEMVTEFGRDFPELSWDFDSIMRARRIFPNYVSA